MNALSRALASDPFEDLLRGFFIRPVEFGHTPPAPTLKADVRETDEVYIIHAELPGVRKEDIQVNIDGSVVSISAQRKLEKEARSNERVLRSERYFGKETRSFQLAQDIDDNAASAQFTDGVLELTLPKRAAAQVKRLTIN
jgi:HSP20 family protein